MTKKPMIVLAAVGLVLALAGCDAPAQDRSNANADGYKDATQVIIWKNADQVPNVATFCADNLAWAATLSSDGTKTPQLLRVPEHDDRCAR